MKKTTPPLAPLVAPAPVAPLTQAQIDMQHPDWIGYPAPGASAYEPKSDRCPTTPPLGQVRGEGEKGGGLCLSTLPLLCRRFVRS